MQRTYLRQGKVQFELDDNKHDNAINCKSKQLDNLIDVLQPVAQSGKLSQLHTFIITICKNSTITLLLVLDTVKNQKYGIHIASFESYLNCLHHNFITVTSLYTLKNINTAQNTGLVQEPVTISVLFVFIYPLFVRFLVGNTIVT